MGFWGLGVGVFGFRVLGLFFIYGSSRGLYFYGSRTCKRLQRTVLVDSPNSSKLHGTALKPFGVYSRVYGSGEKLHRHDSHARIGNPRPGTKSKEQNREGVCQPSPIKLPWRSRLPDIKIQGLGRHRGLKRAGLIEP